MSQMITEDNINTMPEQLPNSTAGILLIETCRRSGPSGHLVAANSRW